MFSQSTENYHLPQWQNNDKPTWLGDMNGAFENIDANMKRIEDKAEEGGVPQSIIDRIVALENGVSSIVTQIGTDAIDTIGTSITNAIVNLKSAIDNVVTSVSEITTKIGTDVIDTIGTSITNAIVNLKSAIDNVVTSVSEINTKIGTDAIDTIGTSITNAIVNLNNAINTMTSTLGNTNISDVGSTITQAIRNLADSGGGVPQSIIDRIVALENGVSSIVTQIGTDVIDTIGTSITNAIVNLKSAIDNVVTSVGNITTQIGNVDISSIGSSITQAIKNIADNTESGAIVTNTEIATLKTFEGKTIYKKYINVTTTYSGGSSTVLDSVLTLAYVDRVLRFNGSITIGTSGSQITQTPYGSTILGFSIYNNGLILGHASGQTGSFIAFCEIEYTKR